MSPHSSDRNQHRLPNPFYNSRITKIHAVIPTVVLRIPFECFRLFQIDRYAHQPKLNPWADKEYVSWTYNMYPDLLRRASYKSKDQLIHKLKVSVIEKGLILAQERHLLKTSNLITVVEGTLRFFKRDKDLDKVFGTRLIKPPPQKV